MFAPSLSNIINATSIDETLDDDNNKSVAQQIMRLSVIVLSGQLLHENSNPMNLVIKF